MFASHKILSGLLALLFILLALSAFNAKAALPDVGTSIGTRAEVTFTVGGVQEKSISNMVSTTIAQVYATDIKSLSGTVPAKEDTNADMLFAVKNIGNGIDDVTLTVVKFPQGIASVEMFVADSSGVPVVSTGRTIKDGEGFSLSGIPRDQIKNIVVRMAVPKNTPANTDYKFEFQADNISKKDPQTVDGDVHVVSEIPFTVAAGNNVSLNEKNETLVAFKVHSGTSVKGYFEVILAKKSDLSRTAVDFVLLNKKIVFNSNDLDINDIKVDQNKRLLFTVDAMPENWNTDFKMNIEIPSAKDGDEFVMFVKYAKADANGIAPAGKLSTSTELQISNVAAMAKPTLLVIGNSATPTQTSTGNDDLATLADAISGGTVSYTLTLKNESKVPENFSLALDYISNQSIRNMTVLDELGNRFNAASGSGLPETGLIAAGKTITFKVQIDLAHAVTNTAEQTMKLTVKSLTESKTAAVTQNFKISTVNAIAEPIVTFFLDKATALGKSTESIDAFGIAGRDDFAAFYMRVQAPKVSNNANSRNYEIKFDQSNATFQMLDGDNLGQAFQGMAATFADGEAKVFLVKVDMRGMDMLNTTATATDVLGKVNGKAAITVTKAQSVGFVELGYAGNGSPDLDTLLTVQVKNHGSDIAKGEYAIDLASVDGWVIAFRKNNDPWKETFELPKMQSGESQAIQVKIIVPKDASAGMIKSLNLILRNTKGMEIESKTALTVTIGKSKLLVSKTVAVVDAGDGTPAASLAFAENGQRAIKHGDMIWYQVVVTNPIDAPVAKNVRVSDQIPPHSTFESIDKNASPPTSTSAHTKDSVTLDVDAIEPGVSVTLRYKVEVKLEK